MYRRVISGSRSQPHAAPAQRSRVTDAASVAALSRLIEQKIADAGASPPTAAPGKPQRRNLWLRDDLLQAAPAGRPSSRPRRRRKATALGPGRRRTNPARRAARPATGTEAAPAKRLRVTLTWLLTGAFMLATAATAYDLLNTAPLPAQAGPGAPAVAVRDPVRTANASVLPAAVPATGDGAALASQVQALREDNILLQERVNALRTRLADPGTSAD